MATITYDGLVNPNSLITFTDVPNILKVEDTDRGTYATIVITVNTAFQTATTRDSQWYITVVGDTITNMKDPDVAINTFFWVAPDRSSTAASIGRALRACPTVTALFTVNITGTVVTLTARNKGNVLTPTPYDTNITSNHVSAVVTEGYAASDYANGQIFVDVLSDGNYITTLEKNYYGKECAFNMSPVLTTLAEHGKATPYQFRLSYKDLFGLTHSIATTSTHYITPGYMVNQGAKYLPLTNNTILAQNFKRGSSRTFVNNTLLYVYGNTIPLSYYKNTSGVEHIDVIYRDSAGNRIDAVDDNAGDTDPNDKLKDYEIKLDSPKYKDAFYVDIKIEDSGEIIRYNVIKPIKAAEGYTRLLWRNSYGGISFFDFTGAKSETREVDIKTYHKNIYDYYTNPMNELEKIFDNEVKYNVTLKSHLFEEDGKYIFNDLLQSTEAWVVVNGEKYAVIIDNVSVDELSDRNNIYEATVRYHYSANPSLI